MAKISWNKVLFNLLTVIPSVLNIVRHLVSCIEYEAQLAKKSLVMLVILFVFATALTLSAWLCLCTMLFVWLHVWFSLLASLAILLATQIVLLCVVGIIMARTKENLLFKHTRELFH